MRLSLLLAVVAVVSACGGGGDPTVGPSPAPEADGTTTAAPAPVDPATTTGDAVVLEAGSLHASEALDFGEASREEVTSGVEIVLDSRPTAQESQMECGPGPLDSVSWEGLDLYFSDGTLAAWYLDEPQPAGVDVARGVGLGSTLQDLRTAFGDVTAQESTLGYEFSAGGISGIMSSAGDSATVEVMWAGATCIAR